MSVAASFIGIWLATRGVGGRITGIVALILFGGTAYYLANEAATANAKLQLTYSTARQANSLIQKRGTSFTDNGFVLAALAFLEAHEQEYPDSYERAKAICENYGCTKPLPDLRDSYNAIDAASAMSALLGGIAIMSDR